MFNNSTLRQTIVALYWVFLLVPLYVLSKNVNILSSFKNPAVAAYIFLRLSGLYAFFLVFLQIMWGGFMPFWKKIFDDKAVVSHEKMGVIAYTLILAHPTFFLISAYLSGGLKSAVLTLIPSISSDIDLYLTYGKIGLTLFSLSVLAAYFRHLPFFNRGWLAFHLLNYVAFWFVFVHSWKLGSDTHTFPLNILFPAMAFLVASSIVYHIAPHLLRVRKPSRVKVTQKR